MTENRAGELADCPFCGGKPEAHHMGEFGRVICRHCGVGFTVIAGLSASIAAWNKRVKPSENILREALEKADEAMSAWLHQFAGEFCTESEVKIYRGKVQGAGGTLGYISDVTQKIRAALAK